MATYTVKAPDGKTITLQGPDGASQDEIISQAQALYQPATPPVAPAAPSVPADVSAVPVSPATPPVAPAAPSVPGASNAPSAQPLETPDGSLNVAVTGGRFPNKGEGGYDDFIKAGYQTDPTGKIIGPPLTQAQKIQQAGQQLSDSTPGNDLGKGFVGGLRAFPGANYLTAAAERILPSHLNIPGIGDIGTGNDSNASFDDILKVAQARTAADQAKSTIGNIAGQITGGIGGLGAIGKIGGAIPGVSNVLQALAPEAAQGLDLGTRALNLAKTAGAGAAGGAAYAANAGDNVGQGALTGAIAAPALGVAGNAVNKLLLQPVATALRIPSAGAILRKYVGTTAEEVQQAASDWQARNPGATQSPTVYEVLDSLKDRESVRDALARMPASARDNAAALVRQRGADIGPEMQGTIANVTQPARDQITNQMTNDLTAARGGTPDPGDAGLVQRASTVATSFPAFRRAEAQAIMAPHENTPVVDNLSDLYPSISNSNGPAFDADPEVTAAIRAAAGSLGRRQQGAGVNAGEITNIIANLGDHLDEGLITGGAAQRAIDHLRDTISERVPEAANAAQQMTNAFAARSRMGEGVDEGMLTRLRAEIPGATNNLLARKMDNIYDTPEGQVGRTLGQINRLTTGINKTPDVALNLSQQIANNPSMQEAISANLGGRGRAGATIADAAQAQTESARRLAGLGQPQEGQGNVNLASMMHSIVGLHPGSLPGTKIRALTGLSQVFQGLPEGRANMVVNALFSRNPTHIASALKMLNNAGDTGQAALRSLATSIGTGGVAADESAAPAQPSIPPVTLPPIPEIGTAAAAQAVPSAAVDPASSPYAPQLQKIYDTENPDLIALVNRVQHQESGGKQHDASGQPLTSKAGAIGTMQVMPGTAPEAAKLAGVAYDDNAYRNDPAYNKILGIAQLSQLLRKYDGNVAKATAAYNAGSGRVDAAVKKHGESWLAATPAETQNYVARVS